MLLTSEPRLDITSSAAIFSVIVPVCLKLLTAAGAGEIIDSFSVDLFYMFLPPLHPAFIGTELFDSRSRRLLNGSAAA
jgi:hypothetical protein